MDYAETSYFNGYQFQHIAAWLENKRLRRKHNEMVDARRKRR